MNKRYVDVLAKFSANGCITPLAVVSESGIRHDISRITNQIFAASQKSGGVGMRYTCYIGTKMFYLFLEENKWFMEA
ncbi:MAG: hypothetical protein RR716_00665 [Christensenellaceae bacterium]